MNRGGAAGRFGAGALLRRVLRRFGADPPVTPGVLEPAELRRLVGKPDPVILEIGCNDGTHTLMFLALFERARVYAFEPDPRACRRFRDAVSDARARLFATAVGAADGVSDFYPSDGAPSPEWAARLPDGWDHSGSIRKPKQHLAIHPWCSFREKIQVEVTRLDTWAGKQAIGEVDFIWADVQGAEADLILGGRQTLKRTRFFYTEYSNAELYEGQASLRRLLGMLPDFEVVHRYQGEVHRYQGDVLLRNTRLGR